MKLKEILTIVFVHFFFIIPTQKEEEEGGGKEVDEDAVSREIQDILDMDDEDDEVVEEIEHQPDIQALDLEQVQEEVSSQNQSRL